MARLEKWKLSDDWTKEAGAYVPGMGKFFADGWYQRESKALNGNGKRPPAAVPPTVDEYYRGAS
jgi:hypothetical protein